MSKRASSNTENTSTGYHINATRKRAVKITGPTCEDMQKCYPPFDLKRFGIALLGVAVVFVVAAFVL